MGAPTMLKINCTLNYNLKNRIWASYSQIIIKLTSVIAENYNLVVFYKKEVVISTTSFDII